MRILGVDPGTHRTGAGVIESEGSRYRLIYSEVVVLNSEEALPYRLLMIHKKLSALVREYRPDVMALENVFYGRDFSAMVKIGEARACAMLAASEYKIPVVEYAPARIKQAVSGSGRATKEQMQYMVKQLLSLKELPQADMADALAVAICHLHSGAGEAKVSKKGSSTWSSKHVLEAFKGRIAAST